MNQSEQQEQIRRLLSSPQGKQLLKALSRDGGASMRMAGEALRRGDTEGAKQIMGPMGEDPEVQKLLRLAQSRMDRG